jgi:hypothetical protein
MDVLRRSERKSRTERINNEHIKEIMGVRGTADSMDSMDSIEKKIVQWYGHVKRMAEERIPKLWNRYRWREGKEDVQEKRGWKDYKQP